MKKLLPCFLIVFLLTNLVAAQSPQFSQSFANPLFQNPALCGESKGMRVMMIARNQWPTVAGGYRTNLIGADYRSPQLRSGLGFSVWRDVAGSNRLAFTNISVYFSHKIRISKKNGINAGIRLGQVMRSVDVSRMLFADQVIRDNAGTTIEPNLLEKISYQEVSIGLLYYSDKWWSGFSIQNINAPNTSLQEGGEVPLPVRFSVHGGILLKEKKGPQTIATKLIYEYKAQQEWDQLDLGLHHKHQSFVLGISYRGLPFKSYKPGYSNRDALIFLIGMEVGKGWKMAYSYDMTISRLSMSSGGAHEISISFEKPKKFKRKKIVVPQCMAW